jgi:hypothetical protein
MPNFKAEYTLEMVLDLIEADLHKDGFSLPDNSPVTFHLTDFGKGTLVLDIVKQPLTIGVTIQEPPVKELSAPAPAEESTAPELGVAKNGKPYKRPPSEKELARRAKISGLMKTRRAEEKAAKAAKKREAAGQVLLNEFPTEAHALIDSVRMPDPTPTPDFEIEDFTQAEINKLIGTEAKEPEPAPQADLRDPADYLLPENKRIYKEPPAKLLELHQQLFEHRLATPSEKKEVVAPAAPTFPGTRF